MLLLIDAGNTLLKWAIPVEGALLPWTAGASRWRHAGAVGHHELEQLARAWHGLAVVRVVVSNVAGAVLRERLQTLLRDCFGATIEIVWFASQVALAGVRNAYREPAQLGCDRFAAAIGAHALFAQRALIVATCGTATTVDAISADGEFLGGMILPGMAMMATSLALSTAQLPQVKAIDVVSTPFADNTTDAIVAGCIAAQAGAIERAVAAHQRRYSEVLCVLAGGAGAMLAPYLAVPCEKVDNLVLIGLQVAATA